MRMLRWFGIVICLLLDRIVPVKDLSIINEAHADFVCVFFDFHNYLAYISNDILLIIYQLMLLGSRDRFSHVGS